MIFQIPFSHLEKVEEAIETLEWKELTFDIIRHIRSPGFLKFYSPFTCFSLHCKITKFFQQNEYCEVENVIIDGILKNMVYHMEGQNLRTM